MKALNFPAYAFDIREQGQKKLIFDIARKKLIPLTPEEWVRQHALHYLCYHFHIKPDNIAVEREFRFHTLKKRFDILLFNANGQPECIVECKAPHIPITQETVLQIAMYNKTLSCPWLWITNGLQHHWIENSNGSLKPSLEPTSWPFTRP